MTRKVGRKLYIIAVNLANRDTKVTVTLPAEFNYDSVAGVRFEDRALKVKNNRFSDKFKALERHVYVIDLK